MRNPKSQAVQRLITSKILNPDKLFLRSVILMTVLFQSNLLSFERKVLRNGVVLLVHQKEKLPILSCVIGFRTGSVYDPENKQGLAYLTSALLDKGIPGKNAIEIQEELSFLGARFNITTSYTFTKLSLTILSENAKRGLDIISKIAFEPTLPEVELEREKRRLKNEILSKKSEADYVSELIFRNFLYKEHPLSHFPEGDENSIENINIQDIRNFYASYFVPQNSFVVLVGNSSEKELLSLGEEFFGNIKSDRNIQKQEIPLPSSIKGISVKIVHMDVNQSFITIGHFGPMRNTPDYSSARVMNYILGGGSFASRLFEEIRNKRGYAYSVYSSFSPTDPFPGPYIFGLQTKIENTNDALKVLLGEIKKIKEKGIKNEELEDAKGYFQGYIPRLTETYEQVAENFLVQELYGLKPFYWEKEVEEILKLKKEEVENSAKKYLDPDNILIVIVTNKEKFKFDVPGISPSEISFEEIP